MSRDSYRVKLGRGSKFTILIGKNKDGSLATGVEITGGQAKRSEGLMPVAQQRNTYIVPGVSESIINFWDLGIHFEDDTWQENDLLFQPGYDPDDYIQGNDPMRLEDYQALMDAVFAIPIEDWRERYHKIEYEEAERYGFDLEIDDEQFPVGRDGSRNIIYSPNPITQGKWTEKGLKYNKVETGIKVKGGLSVNYFYTADTTKYKITEEYDFSAAEVPFDVKGAIDFFLMPRIVNGIGNTLINIGGSPPQLDQQTAVNNYYMMRREFYLDVGLFGDTVPFSDYRPDGDYNDTQKLAIKEEMFGDYKGANGILQHIYGYIVTPHPTPLPPMEEAATNFAIGASFFTTVQAQANYVAGFLLAVAKNGSKTYFIWSKNGTGNTSVQLDYTWP